MAETKRGYAMLIHGGDAEIGTALRMGIMAARGGKSVDGKSRHPKHMRMDGMISAPSDGYVGKHVKRCAVETNALTDEEMQALSEEYRIRRVALKLRDEMHPVPVDYIGKLVDAELEYGQVLCASGVLRRVREGILVGYAAMVMAFERLFERVGVK